MPKPNKGEEKGKFIGRAVRQIMGEGKTQEQALGEAYGLWRQHHKETSKSFLEAFFAKARRGPPRLAEAVGTRAMDEEGLPVTYPAVYIAGGDDDSEEEKEVEEAADEEDAEELAEEAADTVELRAKTFNDVIKQPTVQGVHVPSAGGGGRRRRDRVQQISTLESDKNLETQDLEAAISTMGQDNIPGEHRRLKPRKPSGPLETEKQWQLPLRILKADPDKRLIFGWASVAETDGQVIVDKQGDIIPADALEDAAYEYVLSSRDGGDMHERRGVSKLVASIVLTPDIKRAMGITKMVPDHVGWFVGFKVHDDDLWAAIKRGERPEFSIGGASHSAAVEDVETYLAHADVFKARKGRRTTRMPFRW